MAEATGADGIGERMRDAGSPKLRLGGMALRNGLLVHGPTHWAAAARRDDGTIAVASGRKPRVRWALGRAPGLRGLARLGEAMAVIPLVRRALPEARLPFEDVGVATTIAATTLGGAVLRRRRKGPAADAALAAISVLPALTALRSGELAAYHGVEHKAIAAYEEDGSDAREAAKEHDRCGSHLVAPLVAANLAGTALLRRALEHPAPAANAAVQLASVGAAVEVFLWSERHADSSAARWLRRPGFELQRLLGTREPTEEQLDVGQAALAEILRVERAFGSRT